MSATCRSCGEPVLWARMAESRKAVPLQPIEEPFTRGAVVLVGGTWAYHLNVLARKIAERERVSEERGRELAISRYPTHVTHFARCPNADQHRRAG